MRELGERGGLGREGETQNVEREKIELGEGRKEREKEKKKGKKQYFAENHGIKNKNKKTIVLQQTAINDCSSIVKNFDNNTTNVALFLWCWLLKVAI